MKNIHFKLVRLTELAELDVEVACDTSSYFKRDTLVEKVGQFLRQLLGDSGFTEAFSQESFERLLSGDGASGISGDNGGLYMFMVGGEIVGMVTLTICNVPSGKKGYVDDVVVDHSARGKGYGSVLMALLEDLAKEKGCKSLFLTSNPTREAANVLYQKMGFDKKITNVYVKHF